MLSKIKPLPFRSRLSLLPLSLTLLISRSSLSPAFGSAGLLWEPLTHSSAVLEQPSSLAVRPAGGARERGRCHRPLAPYMLGIGLSAHSEPFICAPYSPGPVCQRERRNSDRRQHAMGVHSTVYCSNRTYLRDDLVKWTVKIRRINERGLINFTAKTKAYLT